MPPARLNLKRLPLAAQGPDSNDGDRGSSIPHAGEAVGGAVDLHVVEGPYAWAWLRWPLVAISIAYSRIRKWFASLDALLLGLPTGIGPALSALVRLFSLAIAASITSSIISRTRSGLLKFPSRTPAAVVDPYTPGKHSWVAARSRWDPHHCSICSGVIAWVSDSGVRCQICGSHAHTECSKRAHKEGFACKALCRSDMEVAHKRFFDPQGKSGQGWGDEVCGAGPIDEEGKKPSPPVVMKHQWMRGSIDDSRRCLGCGGSCAGSGVSRQRGFFCAWCKEQVHEGCASRVSEAACALGRHRRLILPPIAVLKDHPFPRRKRKSDIIREAMNKVRSVLPRQNDPSASASSNLPHDHPAGSASAADSGQQRGFVEAVREAAAAVAAAANEVELDVAERVRGAVPFGGEDGLWEEALRDAGWRGRLPGDAAIDEAWEANSPTTLRAASSSSVDSPADLLGETPGGRRSTSPDEWKKRWSKGSWTPPLKRGGYACDDTVFESYGRGGEGGGGVAADWERVSQEMRRRRRSMSDTTNKRPNTSESLWDGEAGYVCVLPENERNGIYSEFYIEEAIETRDLEEAKQKALPPEGGEDISSEYVTVETGVLKTASFDDPAVATKRNEKKKIDTLSPRSREPSWKIIAASDNDSVVAEANDLSSPEECDGLGVGGSGAEVLEDDAWEKQGGGEEQEDEEKEWVVKMQELHARHQSSGEGSGATKTPCYARKTRSVTLTVCEDKIPEDICPLVVFVNSKSGGRQGGVLMNRFRALLNPLQVADLSSEDPLEVLKRFRNVRNLRLLVCGGDGTVAWLLQAVDAIAWKGERPPLAILPLGTGNDLARVLGWGSGYAGEGVEALLDTIESAQVTKLDRWSVSVAVNASSKGKGAFRKSQKVKDRQLTMNNYIGIGVDGQVALDFHKMRESRPLLFFNRAVNKILYAQVGVRSALARAYRDLPARLELRCDGRLVELPETTASIVAMNINSFGGGSKLWAVEEAEANHRAFATGNVANNPVNSPSTQHATAWAFSTNDGVVLPRESDPLLPGALGSSQPPRVSTQIEGTRKTSDTRPDVRKANDMQAGEAVAVISEEFDAARSGGDGGGTATYDGFEQSPVEFNDLSSGHFDEDGASDDARKGGSNRNFTSSCEGEEFGERDNNEGDRGSKENPRGRVRAASVRPESKSSFRDGLLEVVAVEGVLHFGQIQLGLSRALPVAQCREVKIRTLGTLPMQVDGEPWTQPPSEITVKMHNQAAMLRPATATERAVASVLSDVSQAIDGAEQDLVINERQARALLSRIRRTARVPDGSNDGLLP